MSSVAPGSPAANLRCTSKLAVAIVRSIFVELRGTPLRVVDELALLRRRVDRVTLEAHSAGLLQVDREQALLVVKVQERVAAQVEDARLPFGQALDLAQLPQQREQRLQRFGARVCHVVFLLASQASQRLRRL